jgi:predicted AAA+ superfamily ATPase
VYSRIIKPPKSKSFFLLGPRGTGKSLWARDQLEGEKLVFDLLDAGIFREFLAAPERLGQRIPPKFKGWVVLDEIQKAPNLLDEVHRLIESRGLKFVLTGSSARKLRRGGVNLLAGRALTLAMHPLLAQELGADFDLAKALRYGGLPAVWVDESPDAFLRSYVSTYLTQEVREEGLARRLDDFARFMESASLSQGSILNVSAVARDCGVERKVVEDYFTVLEDLLIGVRLPVFTRRAKRKMSTHPKFYYFDAGVFQALRPRGLLDSAEEIQGMAAETLVLQHLRGLNDGLQLGYSLYFWRSLSKLEVDFVLYGERGFHAVEVKRGARLRPEDFAGLLAFREDYPQARLRCLYGGTRSYLHEGIEVEPLAEALPRMDRWLTGS